MKEAIFCEAGIYGVNAGECQMPIEKKEESEPLSVNSCESSPLKLKLPFCIGDLGNKIGSDKTIKAACRNYSRNQHLEEADKLLEEHNLFWKRINR